MLYYCFETHLDNKTALILPQKVKSYDVDLKKKFFDGKSGSKEYVVKELKIADSV